MALLPEYQKFKARNVLNGLNLNTKIYKWMPLKYVLPMIQNNKLTFTRMAVWEDVYENFFIKGNVIYNRKFVGTDNIQQQLYGQSWSYCSESDALWRIYSDIKQVKNNLSPNYDDVAVRIETTAEKLYNAIYINDNCMANTYIGKVLYKQQVDIESEMQNQTVSFNKLARQIAKHACVKRIEFNHEYEVRPIVFLSSDDNRVANPILQYDIVINQFIDSFVIDPRLLPNNVQDITNILIDAGANPDIISQSSLYQYKPIPLQIV